MAADSAAVSDIRTTTVKLHRRQGWLYGFAGRLSACSRVVELLSMSDEHIFSVIEECRQMELFEESELLLLSPQGTLFHVEDGIPIPVPDPFTAIGTGSGAALAAMHCGRSPKEAVKIASKVDPFTGGRIVTRALLKKPTVDK